MRDRFIVATGWNINGDIGCCVNRSGAKMRRGAAVIKAKGITLE